MDKIFKSLKEQIVGKEGSIFFELNGLKRKVTSTDIIGNTIQDWLPLWFKQNNIKFKTLKNTQEFPDYILNLNDQKDLMLEVKAWNYNNSPAFDIANFESYIDTLEENPSKLYADYLIFGYQPLPNHNILIKDIYLKKVWELTGPSKTRPLRIQVKRGVIYNIRPLDFRKEKSEPFNNEFEFLNAIKLTMDKYNSEKKDMDKWLYHIINNL